jgi:hypothetical protein
LWLYELHSPWLMQKYIPYIFHAHCNQCSMKFQWHPALKPQGGVCTANLTPSFLHALGARLYTASPSRLHRTTDFVSFAFSWLVRSYVGLPFRPYTPYTTANESKNFYLVPSTGPPNPRSHLSLVDCESCTTALLPGPRRLLFPGAGVCCHQCTVLVPPRHASSLPTSLQRYRHPHHVRGSADVLQPFHAHWRSSYEEAQG